jgi:hypothetical protein
MAFAQVSSYYFEDKNAFNALSAFQQTDTKFDDIRTKIMPKVDFKALLKEDSDNASMGDVSFRIWF